MDRGRKAQVDPRRHLGWFKIRAEILAFMDLEHRVDRELLGQVLGLPLSSAWASAVSPFPLPTLQLLRAI